MKKTVHTLILLLCLVLCISACAKTSTTSDDTQTSETSQATLEAALNEDASVSDEDFELSVWADAPTSIIDMDTNTQTTWYEEMTGVHVNWTLVTEEADTKFNLSLASGDYPDIYFIELTTAQAMLNVTNDVFISLSELIDSDSTYFKAILAEDSVLKENITSPDGNIYTFFRTDSGVHMLSQNKMFAYQPWLDELGLEIPVDTDEFEQMLIAFRDNDVNGNGDVTDEIPLVGSYDAWGGDPVAFLMNPFQLWSNDYLIGIDEQVTFVANTDGFREGLKYINKLYKEGLIAEETFVQDTTQLKTLINHSTEEEMLVGVFPTAHVAQYTDLDMMPDALIDYIPISPIEGPTGLRQAETTGYSKIVLYGAITSACTNPDVAMQWVDGLLGGEGLVRNYYGVEGIHFKWSDTPAINGTVPSRTLTFTYLEPDNDWWHNYGIGPIYDTSDLRYQETDVYGYYGWAHYTAHEAYEPYYVGKGLPLISWSIDEEIAVELSELQILIEEYTEQSYTEFILGVRDINDDSEWEAYKAELIEMGLERYIELNQLVNFGE